MKKDKLYVKKKKEKTIYSVPFKYLNCRLYVLTAILRRILSTKKSLTAVLNETFLSQLSARDLGLACLPSLRLPLFPSLLLPFLLPFLLSLALPLFPSLFFNLSSPPFPFLLSLVLLFPTPLGPPLSILMTSLLKDSENCFFMTVLIGVGEAPVYRLHMWLLLIWLLLEYLLMMMIIRMTIILKMMMLVIVKITMIMMMLMIKKMMINKR